MQIVPVEIPCDGVPGKGNNDKGIVVTENKLDFKINFYQYFDTVTDESLVMVDSRKSAFLSHDGDRQ